MNDQVLPAGAAQGQAPQAAGPVSAAVQPKTVPRAPVKKAAKAYLTQGNAALDWSEF